MVTRQTILFLGALIVAFSLLGQVTGITNLESKAQSGDTEAMSRLGDDYYYGNGVSKDIEMAIQWYELAANDDYEPSPSAQYQLAQIYLKGECVEKDSVYAAELLLHSAGGGFLTTKQFWWYDLNKEKANKLAEQKLIELCTLENSASQHIFLVLTGCLFVAKNDYKKAEDYFKKAINKGSILSEAELGLMYFYIALNTPQLYPYYGSTSYEDEIDKDLLIIEGGLEDKEPCLEYVNQKKWTKNDNVVYWLEQAIEDGFGHFKFGSIPYDLYEHLLFVYFNGVGIQIDYNKAIDLVCEQLLDNDHGASLRFDAEYVLEIARKKPELANKLYSTYNRLFNELKKSDNQDKSIFGLASEGLGRCYYNGTGVGKSFEMAFKYFTIAHQNGNNYATCELGEMYYNGDYKKRDYSKAFSLFDKASELEHYMTINSMIMLSSCYRYGYGTSKDLQKAEYWLKKAQEAGDETLNRINQIKGNKN